MAEKEQDEKTEIERARQRVRERFWEDARCSCLQALIEDTCLSFSLNLLATEVGRFSGHSPTHVLFRPVMLQHKKAYVQPSKKDGCVYFEMQGCY